MNQISFNSGERTKILSLALIQLIAVIAIVGNFPFFKTHSSIGTTSFIVSFLFLILSIRFSYVKVTPTDLVTESALIGVKKKRFLKIFLYSLIINIPLLILAFSGVDTAISITNYIYTNFSYDFYHKFFDTVARLVAPTYAFMFASYVVFFLVCYYKMKDYFLKKLLSKI